MSFSNDNRPNGSNPFQSLVQFGERLYQSVWRNINPTNFDEVTLKDMKKELGKYYLHEAVRLNLQINILEAFLKTVDINLTDKLGNIALHYCTNTEVAKLLCNSGSYVNLPNRTSRTPLHILAGKQKVAAILHYLLQKDSEVDQRDKFGLTPLHIACQESLIENVQVLLYYGAATTEETDMGYTPLMAAAEKKSTAVIEELWPYLDYQEINHLTNKGDTLLMILVKSKQKHWAVKLLDMEPQLDYIDCHNFDALDLSIFMEDSECFKIIWDRLENKIDFSWKLFFEYCCFSKEDFLDTLHMLLSTSTVQCFYNIRIRQLLDAFERFDLSSDDCLKVIYTMLSFGYEVKSCADIYMHMIFQSSLSCKYDLFRVIIEFVEYIPLYHTPDFYWVRAGNSEKFNLNDYVPLLGQRYEIMLCNYLVQIDPHQYLNKDVVMFLLSNITRYLHFTCSSSQLKETYRKNWGPEVIQSMFGVSDQHEGDASLEDLLMTTSKNIQIFKCVKIPSLLELCRDFVRELLIKKFHDDPRGVRNMWIAIDSLTLPPTLKKVLLFQQPIYNCNDLDCRYC